MLVLGEGEIPQCSPEGFPAAERRFICRCIPPHPPAYLRNRPDAEVIAVHKIPALRMEREDVACVLVRVPLAGPVGKPQEVGKLGAAAACSAGKQQVAVGDLADARGRLPELPLQHADIPHAVSDQGGGRFHDAGNAAWF